MDYAYLVVDLVLERALLGREAVAQGLELVVVGRGGQLGLDARLEAGLGLAHQFGAVNSIGRAVRRVAKDRD